MKKYCHFFYSTREGTVQTEISSFTLDVVVNILKQLVKVNKKLERRGVRLVSFVRTRLKKDMTDS